MPTYTPLILNNRELSLPKSIVSPELGARTVLTNEPWNYVELALAREKKNEAKFYWQQAREFFTAATGLPLRSAPLLFYYAFMNATKALLAAKSLLPAGPIYHGVKRWNPTSRAKPRGLSTSVEIVRQSNGVLFLLANYYGETEPRNQHTLKDIFFNLPFIHRTFSLTYTKRPEMFVPLRKQHFVTEDGTSNVFLKSQLSEHFSLPIYMQRMPSSFRPCPSSPLDTVISSRSVSVSSPANLSPNDVATLATFARTFREDVDFINGIETLWYVKSNVGGSARIQRQSTTLTLAAMHRLSEICRYTPMQMMRLLEGHKNWLLSEFITMSGNQFIDAIASEITGKQFLTPNVRQAT